MSDWIISRMYKSLNWLGFCEERLLVGKDELSVAAVTSLMRLVHENYLGKCFYSVYQMLENLQESNLLSWNSSFDWKAFNHTKLSPNHVISARSFYMELRIEIHVDFYEFFCFCSLSLDQVCGNY